VPRVVAPLFIFSLVLGNDRGTQRGENNAAPAFVRYIGAIS
jgi:hypothetical protein